MRTQRHPNNFIWLLITVWLSVALASYAFSYPMLSDALANTKQDTLRVYTDNDDVALEETKELQEKIGEAVFRIISFIQLLCLPRDAMLVAFAIFCCFVPLRIFRYIRRRTRTPALLIHIA